MINFIFCILLWTFALYGFFHFIFYIFRTIYNFQFSSKGIYVFIAVKNQEKIIEGFLRSIIFKLIYKDDNIDNIFVIDLNSTDRTADILDMLSSDYEYIQFTDLRHCKKILDSISQEK